MKNKKPDFNAKKNQDSVENLSRRNLIKGAGLVGAAALGATATSVSAASNPAQSIPTREALEVLTALEAETLEAICDCLIPSDENGPGAKEARAVHYIDRSLASHNVESRESYLIGLSALNDYAMKTRGKNYPNLITDVQNSILLAMQENKLEGFSPSSAGFFNLVRNHTIEGTFCDPYYGGNQNFVGWDLVNYPGIRLSASETDVAAGASLAPNHQSAYDHATYTKMSDNINLASKTFEGSGGADNA